MAPEIWVIHGPNLGRLGKREPSVYGAQSLAELNAQLQAQAQGLGATARCFQSDHEGQLIQWLHEAEDAGAVGVVLNPAGYTHTSVALRDAVAAIALPVVEVHLSNVFAREPFRHHSFISPVAAGVITGLGARGYALALQAALAIGLERQGAQG